MKSIILCDDGKVRETAARCEKHGFGIEMQAFYDPGQHTPAQMETHLIHAHDIKVKSIHGCFGDLNPGSFDPMVRGVAKNRFELSLNTAYQLQVSHLVLHLGYVPCTSPVGLWLKRCTGFWQDFLKGRPKGISYHVENMLELEPALLADFIDALSGCPVDANLDVGHAHCNSKADVLKWVEVLGKRIGYVHLHDNNGKEDEHLGIGEGSIPFKEVCPALDQYAPDAYWAIEAEGKGIEISIDWLIKHDFIEPGQE